MKETRVVSSGAHKPTAPAGRLAELEQVIERGLTTFVEVGRALMTIRDERLYKPEFKTFDIYLSGRWKGTVSRSYASRLIGAAGIVKMLPIGNTPATEAVARELSPLADDPEKVREVWGEVTAAHGEPPTAATVRAAVRERLPEPTPPALENDVATDVVREQDVREQDGALTPEQKAEQKAEQKVKNKFISQLMYSLELMSVLKETRFGRSLDAWLRRAEPLPKPLRRWLVREARKRSRELTKWSSIVSKWADQLETKSRIVSKWAEPERSGRRPTTPRRPRRARTRSA